MRSMGLTPSLAYLRCTAPCHNLEGIGRRLVVQLSCRFLLAVIKYELSMLLNKLIKFQTKTSQDDGISTSQPSHDLAVVSSF